MRLFDETDARPQSEMAALPHGLTLAASSLGNKWAVPALLDDASLVDAVAALQWALGRWPPLCALAHALV